MDIIFYAYLVGHNVTQTDRGDLIVVEEKSMGIIFYAYLYRYTPSTVLIRRIGWAAYTQI